MTLVMLLGVIFVVLNFVLKQFNYITLFLSFLAFTFDTLSSCISLGKK